VKGTAVQTRSCFDLSPRLRSPSEKESFFAHNRHSISKFAEEGRVASRPDHDLAMVLELEVRVQGKVKRLDAHYAIANTLSQS